MVVFADDDGMESLLELTELEKRSALLDVEGIRDGSSLYVPSVGLSLTPFCRIPSAKVFRVLKNGSSSNGSSSSSSSSSSDTALISPASLVVAEVEDEGEESCVT